MPSQIVLTKAHCLGCGIPFARYKPPGQTKGADRVKYCNIQCYRKNCKGILRYNWKGLYLTARGYLRTSASTGRRNLHLIIAERALGRPFKRGEVVHHIDGNKANNQNANLLICSREYHQWLHWEMSRLYQLEHFGKQSL